MRLFFSTLFLVVLLGEAHAQPTVTWYENLFRDRKQWSIEQALSQKSRQLQLAVTANDAERQITLLNELAVLHLTRTYDYGEAMDALIKAMVLEEANPMPVHQVFTDIIVAKVFQEIGYYDKAGAYLLLALEKSGSDQVLASLVLTETGELERLSGRSDDSRETFMRVLDMEGDPVGNRYHGAAYFNLGILAAHAGKTGPALANLKKALSVFRAIGDKQDEALALDEIGRVYRMVNNIERAILNYRSALDIRQRIADRKGMAATYNHLAGLFLQQKNVSSAIDNLLLGLHEARTSQDRQQLLTAYDMLSEAYEALDNPGLALKYKDDYIAMLELIQGEINEQKSIEAQSRFELARKESAIDALEVDRKLKQDQLDRAQMKQSFLIALVFLSFVIIVLVIVVLLQKRRDSRKLNQQNTQLQELNVTKDKFFSIISHDLKGPLNSLSSFSNLLMHYSDKLSKEEIRLLATDLDKSLKNLFSLLDNLLEWSRSQTGNIDFNPEPCDVVEMLSQNRDLLSSQAKAKHIEIHQEAHGSLMVDIHKNSVNTVIRNLMSNAIKFTASNGSVWINACTTMDGDIEVSVRDSGVGMAPEIVDKLFRIDSKHSTKGTADEKGTGLGLILCKEFVERNGGRMWVESAEGCGSTFHFTLPQKRAA